jgi:predicted nucleic acid-binding protein
VIVANSHVTVLDASCVVRILLREAGWEDLHAGLSDHEFIAPELVLAEVGNAVWRRTRSGAIAPGDGHLALARAAAVFQSLVPLAPLRAQALDLALRRDHPIYDCLYVALAMREAAPLLTADRRLAERFGKDVEVRLVT